jgi:hypothetical protein
LLEEALESGLNGKNLEISSKYAASLVRSGALVKTLFESNSNVNILNAEEFNEKSPDFEVNIFQS